MERTHPSRLLGVRISIVAVVLALLLLPAAADVRAGGPAAMVKDINPSGDSNPTWLTRVGDTLFFAANDGVHGVELWKSEGATTKMVKDIRVGTRGSAPEWLTRVGDSLFFTANDGQHKRQLWKTDGTNAGTVVVTNIVNPGDSGDTPSGLRVTVRPVSAGSRLFFFNDIPNVGTSDLYVTDGTATGTRILTEQDALTIPYWSTAAAYNGKMYFVAVNSFDDQARLWVSNGTPRGTKQVGWSPANIDEIYILPVSGHNLYFTTVKEVLYEGPFFRLWKTDGTAAGTTTLTSSGEIDGAPSQAGEAVLMGGRIYFNAGALWKTNGTVAGTKPILNRPAYFLAAAGDQLYFMAGVTGSGYYLWISDGAPAGTNPFMEFGGLMPRQMVAVGDGVCFVVEDFDADTWALWETDGTEAGTYAVRSFVNPHATTGDGPMGVPIGASLFFVADDGSHGVELWSYTP